MSEDRDAFGAAVALAFWRELGRPPDADGLRHYVQRLEQGAEWADVLGDIACSLEGQRRQAALSNAQWWCQDGLRTPFTVDEALGSTRLIVTFSGLSMGESPPPRLPLLSLYKENVLAIGDAAPLARSADEFFDWASAAARLVGHVSRLLSIRAEDIVCVGHSFAGTRAGLVAALSGAATVFSGAPGIRCGYWAQHMKSLAAEQPTLQPLYDELYEGADEERQPGSVSALDDLVGRALRSAHDDLLWNVVISESDSTYIDAVHLQDLADQIDVLTVALLMTDYIGHEAVEAPFLLQLEAFLLSLK